MIDEVNLTKCTYCGATANCREHVIPVSYLSLSRSYDPEKNWITPSCDNCNSLAGASVCLSIPEKAQLIKKRFTRKFSKVLNQPEWSNEELSEVSYSLREAIWGSMVAKRVAIERLNHLEYICEKPVDWNRPKFIEEAMHELRKMMEEIKKQAKKRKKKKKK